MGNDVDFREALRNLLIASGWRHAEWDESVLVSPRKALTLIPPNESEASLRRLVDSLREDVKRLKALQAGDDQLQRIEGVIRDFEDSIHLICRLLGSDPDP